MPENERKHSILKKLLQNVFWLFLQLGVTRFSAFVIIVLLARHLTQAAYGHFSYAMSVLGMLVVFSDIGLTSVLLREASKKREETSRIFTQTALVKLSLMSAVFAAFILFVFATSGTDASAVVILAVAVFIETLARFFSVAFGANEKMHMLLAGDAIHKAVLLPLLWVVLSSSPALGPVGLCYFAAGALLLIYYAVSFQRVFGLSVPRLGWEDFKGNAVSMLKASAPMALGGAIMTIYVNTDIILIKWLKGPEATGVYAACYNFYLGVGAISSFVIQAVVPRLSVSLEAKAEEDIDFILRGTVKVACMLSLPFAVGGFLLSREILTFFYGNAYLNGDTAFRIFMCTLPLNFLNLLFSYYLFAARLQNESNLVYVASLGLNILLNLLLIPHYGTGGAAAATLAAEMFFMAVFLWRHEEFFKLFSLRWAVQLFLALAALALCTIFLPPGVNLVVRILLGALVYCAALAATGILAGEARLLRVLLKKGPVNAETHIAG